VCSHVHLYTINNVRTSHDTVKQLHGVFHDAKEGLSDFALELRTMCVRACVRACVRGHMCVCIICLRARAFVVCVCMCVCVCVLCECVGVCVCVWCVCVHVGR